MGNLVRAQILLNSYSTKCRVYSAAKRSRTLLSRGIKRRLASKPNPNTWYQQRKRASQRLRNLSGGNITIFEPGYRGHQRRHWMRSERCEHIFTASLREVALAKGKICPFCHPPVDLSLYGSVAAVQELVYTLSFGNIQFADENVLKNADDLYEFICQLHRHRYKGTFSKFIKEPMQSCAECSFENQYRSSQP